MSLISELKRRNVFRVGVAYAIVGWLLIEVASVLLPTFDAPDWVMKAFSSLVILGFPLTLVIAWAFELTPEGIKREAQVDRTESITHVTGRKLDFAIIGLLAIAVVFMFVDNYVLDAEPEQAEVAVEEIPAVEPIEREKSIAVLPFKNLSDNDENVYFSDGVMEAILNDLARIRDLKVVSRTSVEAYRDTSKSIPLIGSELDVAHVLEGSVQRSGDRVRVNAQLIATQDDRHLWSSNYDRDISDIFKIQSEIGNAISRNLELILTSEEKELMANAPTSNLQAYDLYLQSRGITSWIWWVEATAEAVRESLDLCQQAVILDTEFALAYACIGNNLHKLGIADYVAVDEWKQPALENLNKALSLDPSLWEAHATLADISFSTGDYASGYYYTNKLLQYHPNHPEFLAISSYEKLSLGQFERAVDIALRSLMLIPNGNYTEQSSRIFAYLDPMDPELFESFLLDKAMESPNEPIYDYIRAENAVSRRDYDEYLTRMTRVYERTPTPNTKIGLGLAYSFSGDFETSRRIYSEIMSSSEGSENILLKYPFMHRYANTLIATGEEARGLEIMRAYRDQLLESVSSNTPLHGNMGVYYDLSLIFAALGDNDEAMKWLRTARKKQRDGAFFDLRFIQIDTMLDPIRDEPEFIAMLQEIRDEQDEITEIFRRRLKERQDEGRLLWLTVAN
jgi:TolB-like protein